MDSDHCVAGESIAGKYFMQPFNMLLSHYTNIKTSPAANELVVRMQVSAKIPKNVSFSTSNL